jgi:hypothetical protein
MIELSADHVRRLEEGIAGGAPLEAALPASVGNAVAGGGLWRFFSDTLPPRGVRWWNESSGWREHWKSLLPAGLFSFGEDVFGNQVVVVPGAENVFLWSHEDGGFVDLLLAPAELLSTVAESGIDWIDFYGNGSLEVARNFGRIPDDSHLHWTTPLILGGAVSSENISVVERERHLVGHAKLWFQVRGLGKGDITDFGKLENG